MKKISIITATFNAESVLERFIQSIALQKTEEIEFLIIDGGSKDRTKDIISKYHSLIDYTISEPDRGIYDAWNKGIKMATGEWIMFVGADDILTEDALATYLAFIKENTMHDFDLISSKRKMVDLNGKEIRIVGSKWEWPTCLKGMMISHPGALHSSRLFNRYGLYDIQFKIAGDLELLLRPKAKLKTSFIDKVTIVVSEGGVSDSFAAIKEHYKAVILHLPEMKYTIFINDLITTIKYFTKQSFRKVGLNIHLNK